MAKKPESQKVRRGRPRTGVALSAAERMQRMRQRRKAAGLKPIVAWVPAGSPPYSSHRLLEARSLAMHALIAAKIERDPALLATARRNLERWTQSSHEPRRLSEWREILRRPWPEIASLITEQSEEAIRLRQSSPFAGVLSAEERRRVYEAFRA
jgi:hypothetical protein